MQQYWRDAVPPVWATATSKLYALIAQAESNVEASQDDDTGSVSTELAAFLNVPECEGACTDPYEHNIDLSRQLGAFLTCLT